MENFLQIILVSITEILNLFPLVPLPKSLIKNFRSWGCRANYKFSAHLGSLIAVIFSLEKKF